MQTVSYPSVAWELVAFDPACAECGKTKRWLPFCFRRKCPNTLQAVLRRNIADAEDRIAARAEGETK